MSVGDDVFRAFGVITWLFAIVANVLTRVVALPLIALGRLARYLDLPPEGAPCPLRGETHDWEEEDETHRTCETCGKTERITHPGL